MVSMFTGCMGVKIVRIPIPVPTFGFGGDKETRRKPVDVQSNQTAAELPSGGMVGTASWYGPKFHGKRTASGEIFNMNAMTAAHPTLPFNTRVRITNLDNGQKAIVRINDRGPLVNGRIIDVSREAARKLDFEQKGLANVRLEIL
ncbi:MAG: septal ring lytic transglycosylase RlpA family protein [bacterium]|nr:septal ring lytic transglycosylase RlpA family protein [bacterium]